MPPRLGPVVVHLEELTPPVGVTQMRGRQTPESVARPDYVHRSPCLRCCSVWRNSLGANRELQCPALINEVGVRKPATRLGPAAVQVEQFAPAVGVT